MPAENELVSKLKADLKTAMRSRAKEKTAALRLIIAAVENKEIAKRAPLTNEETIDLLKTEAKKRQESLDIYQKANRQELAQKEAFELKLIQEFLPEQLDETKIKEMVGQMKAAGQLPENFGEAMKQVMAKLKGQADGRVVAQVVKAAL